MNIIQDPASPKNYSPGRFGSPVNLGILHTEDGYEAGTDSWFANPAAHVSTQYSVALDGAIRQHVSEGDTAWGAGNWAYNTRSVQIEFEDLANPNGIARTDAQYASGAELIADISRRHGIPLDRAHWLKHGEVPGADHKNCPGNLDVDRLLREAQAHMVAAPVVPAAASVPGVNAWGPEKVRVTVSVLKVHAQLPTTSEDAGNFANTPDGMLHLGQLADANGWVRGLTYTVGGQTSDVWLHSPEGHYYAALCTDFFSAAPNVTLIAQPQYEFVTQPTTLRITPAQGANLRNQPATNGGVVEAKPQGVLLQADGYVANGGDVNGDTKWWRVGNEYVSNAVVAVVVNPQPAPTAPSAPVAPAPTAAPSVAQYSAGKGAGIAGDILPPGAEPVAPAQGSDPMTVRDYLVSFVAWVMSPFIKK